MTHHVRSAQHNARSKKNAAYEIENEDESDTTESVSSDDEQAVELSRRISAVNSRATSPSRQKGGHQSAIVSLQQIPSIIWHNSSFTAIDGPYRLCITAFGLGIAIMTGIMIMIIHPYSIPWPFGAFVTLWATFHWMEFTMTAIFHPDDLTFTSFLLNHSRAFHVALFTSIMEFFVEWLLFPSLKQSLLSMSWLFVIIVMVAQVLRTVAMLQAGANFTHLVAHYHVKDHELVTDGVYNLVRHPSYVAWFFWSISTQFLLGNPICAVGFAYVSWKFFEKRIEYEEERMIAFFGQRYVDYQTRVPCGIPFLRTQREMAYAAQQRGGH